MPAKQQCSACRKHFFPSDLAKCSLHLHFSPEWMGKMDWYYRENCPFYERNVRNPKSHIYSMMSLRARDPRRFRGIRTHFRTMFKPNLKFTCDIKRGGYRGHREHYLEIGVMGATTSAQKEEIMALFHQICPDGRFEGLRAELHFRAKRSVRSI